MNSSKKDDTSNTIPNPTSALLWFFTLTTLYFVVRSLTIKFPVRGKTQLIIHIIYLISLVGGEFVINMGLAKSMCGSEQFITAVMATFIPWIFIFGTLESMLQMFPGWLRPFSNTIGYLFTKGRISRTMSELHNELGHHTDKKNMSGVQKALATIYEDKSLLINEATTSNFDDFWTRLSPLFKEGVRENNDLKYTLLKHIDTKESVAKYIWYILTGGLITSASYNYIVNAGCKYSADELDLRQEKIKKMLEEESKSKENVDEMVYTTYE